MEHKDKNKIVPCYWCKSEGVYRGTTRLGFVECSNPDCQCSSSYSIEASTIFRWNKTMNGLAELYLIKKTLADGRSWSPLSDGEKKALLFIALTIEEGGKPPTVTDVAEAIGMARPTANRYVSALCGKGYISREHNRTRSLKVLHMPVTDEAV